MFRFPFRYGAGHVAALHAGAVGSGILTAFGPLNATGNSVGWNGWTLVSLIPSGNISNTGHEQTRVTFMGGVSGTENAQVSMAYIGMRAGSGDAYDFAATPVQLLVSASGSFTVPVTGTLTTDWADFEIVGGADLLVAMSFNNSAHDVIGIRTPVASATLYQRNAAGDAATVNKTSYTVGGANTLAFVRQIEVQTP